MSRVADDVRREQMSRQLALSVDERIALALSLGERAIQELAARRGVTRAVATRELQRQRQQGRRPSACHDAVVG